VVNVVVVYNEVMSTYHRRNRQFESRLAVRRDELQAATVTRDETGRVVISALPAYSFPTQDCAEQFIRRVLMQREQPTNRRSQ
jgi:hypothetical protein